MKILGISGKRETGKSTLATSLGANHGWIRVSLADWLKEFCQKAFDLTSLQLWGTDKEKPTQYKRTDGTPLTGRDIMIRTGIYFRSIDPLFFCKRLDEKMEKFKDDPTAQKFVIDDIRFLNEIHYYSPRGAKFVRLERSEKAIGKAALDDLSETELDTFKQWDAFLPAEENKSINDLVLFAVNVDKLWQP